MHIVRNKSISKSAKKKKIYQSVLLRESYRENGKVKKRTIANLSKCTEEEIAAIELALKYKGDLSVVGSLKEKVELEEGLSIGAIWTVYQVAKSLGIERALGKEFNGKLGMWQIIARVIDQGSRLSAVRLGEVHALSDVLDLRRGFDENDLYANLGWLAEEQALIEKRLFFEKRKRGLGKLFLYDVTSSYLEGKKNYFGAHGYNRDGKKGKKQIVIGLLCDEDGSPLSTEVFAGNTSDAKTFGNQVKKAMERFECREVVFIGDRGMIKRPQIEALPENFHYITAISKPEIETLIKAGVIQIGLFDDNICEVEDNGERYILRRNAARAEEISMTRKSKLKKVEEFVKEKNQYLKEHPRAQLKTAIKDVTKKIEQFKISKWVKVKGNGREVSLEIITEALEKESLLDGCYVIKTDLPKESADKKMVHDSYKDLALIEKAFRDCKTVLLKVRPVYVRTEKSTRGHVLVVVLSYMITRALRQAWAEFDLTVEEGLKQLSTLCSIKVIVEKNCSCLKIPKPRNKSQELLKALNIAMPTVLPHREVPVVTRKKLPSQRKSL